MTALPRPLYTLSLTLLALGCTGGSETGNPVTSTQLGLSLHTSDPATADVRAGAGGIVIEAAWVSLSDLSLVRTDALPEEEEVEIEGPVVVDLTDPRANLQEFPLLTDSYSSIRADLSAVEVPLPVGAPAELEGHSVLVTGLTPAGLRFTVALDQEAELMALGPIVGFPVDAESSQLALSFDVARWFADLDLDALVPESDGSVRVTVTSNPDALELFEANLSGALELGRDRNGNAILDEGEERLAVGVAP